MNNWKNYFNYIPITSINADLSATYFYHLSNNYPNPFNPSTKITYSIPKRSNVSLKVFDLLGREVAELVNSEIEAGDNEVIFNASKLSSGIYFYRLQASDFIQTKKMILLK